MVVTAPNYEIGKQYAWGTCVCERTLNSFEEKNLTTKYVRTKTHHPVHSVTVNEKFREHCSRMNIELSEPRHLLSNDQGTILSWYNLNHTDVDSSQTTYQTAILNDHTKKFSLTALLGEQVGICTNKQMWAEFINKRKHTANIEIDLDFFMYQLPVQLLESVKAMNKEQQDWKEMDHFDDDMQRNDFVVRTMDIGIIQPRCVPHVLKHLRTPEHPEFQYSNFYNTYQAYTSHWRDTNAFTLRHKCKKLQHLLRNEYRNIVEATKAEEATMKGIGGGVYRWDD
tara:strand:- start:2560 stop:3405 length:846 start_codon:yes stop_codon:yes gene_type:complete